MRNFRKLEIWNLGMELVQEIYGSIEKLPRSEDFGLKAQIKRAVISLPSNIAEGCSRKSNKELSHFLDISLGSSFELETQLLLAESLHFISKSELETILLKLTLFQKKVNAFRTTLQ